MIEAAVSWLKRPSISDQANKNVAEYEIKESVLVFFSDNSDRWGLF